MYWKMYFLSDMFFVLVGIYVEFQEGKAYSKGLVFRSRCVDDPTPRAGR